MNFCRFLFLFCIFAFSWLSFYGTASAECLRGADPLFAQGQEYFEHGQYLLATQQFSQFSLLSCETDHQEKGRVRWAQSLYELGETEEGNRVLEKLGPQSRYRPQAQILKAWYQPSLVSTLPAADQQRFQNWRKQAESLPASKTPWVAGTLSAVIPGLGQVYNGNYQSAAFSFILNALFLSSTIELHNKNLDATAIASGVIFSVVYVGNIVSSVQSAHAINQASQEPAKAEFKDQMFPELDFEGK